MYFFSGSILKIIQPVLCHRQIGTKNRPMNTIFEYLDYREFLRDYYEEKKKENPFFSYKLFGRMVDIDQSYLAKVLIKERHIALKAIKKFIDYFKFDKKEAEYFETLVHFVKAKADKQSKLYFEKLLSYKGIKAQVLTEQQYEFYTKWYYSAIRSLLQYYEFTGDYKALAEKLNPAISVKEAKQAIKLLLKLKLIEKDSNGKYHLVDTAISTGKEWQSLAIHAFQQETIGLARESLDRHPKESRDISTITMNISGKDFEQVKVMIQEFRKSVLRFVNDNASPESVYQMNIQLYPLTKRGKG